MQSARNSSIRHSAIPRTSTAGRGIRSRLLAHFGQVRVATLSRLNSELTPHRARHGVKHNLDDLARFSFAPLGLAQIAKADPSLLSFVDMNTYTLVLSDPTIRSKAKVDLKALKGWPGPAPEHTLLLPDGKKVLVTYMASATEPVGIAVIKINSINWTAGTADAQVVKNLETDKAGTRSTFPPVTQTSPDQYINKKVETDWSRTVFARFWKWRTANCFSTAKT